MTEGSAMGWSPLYVLISFVPVKAARHVFRAPDRDVASICGGHLRAVSELCRAVRLESKSP